MKLKSLGLAVVSLVGFATTAQAAVIFSDSFNRTGDLHGSVVPIVDPTMYPSGLTWTSAVGAGHNTTTTSNDGQLLGGWNAKLAFTPTANKQYLLTLVVGPTIQNALELGFAAPSGALGTYDLVNQNFNNRSTVMIGSQLDYGNRVNGQQGPVAGSGGTYTLSSNTGPGYVNTLTLLLDTTNGLSNSQLTWSINGEQKATWTADVSTYNSVMFGRGVTPEDPNGTQISSIMLEAIPEPSAALLGGLGMLALLRRRRVG